MAARETRKGLPWRLWLTAGAGLVLCVSTAVAAYRVRGYVLTDPQFVLSAEDPNALLVQGLRYASRPKVLRAFAADFGRSVFSVSLAERRRRLLAIDWVEDATVARIWPNRLVVHVYERAPVAFVNLPLATGLTRVLLIDPYGVLLEPPPQSRFSFPVLGGITEAHDEAARRARVRAMMRLLDELGPLGKDISEVNAADLENLRVVTPFEGRATELMLGDGNYARRYQAFLAHYPEIRKRSPGVVAFDLRLDDRITAKEQSGHDAHVVPPGETRPATR